MMIINKLEIKGLYEYINKEIDFYKDLTLLVGINGSGKTSILNIINWMLRPSIPHLCITYFELIKLNFKTNKDSYQIICKHKSSLFSYQIIKNNKAYKPLEVKIIRDPRKIRENPELRANLLKRYDELGPEKEELETWKLIESLPMPTFIGLDRNIIADESSDRIYFEKKFLIKSHNRRNNTTPIDRVKDMVNSEYRKRKNAILNLTNDLKNLLMFSTFEGNITEQEIRNTKNLKFTKNEIERVEKQIYDYLKNFEEATLTTENDNKIHNYFHQLKDIAEKHKKDPQDKFIHVIYRLNASHFNKLRTLLKAFEDFEEKKLKELKHINTYLTTLNFFLKDSAKKIYFKEDTSELIFDAINQKGDSISKLRDIKYLSSGERQLLILFSYIAFNSLDGKIFLIDEPELSLHIKWQESFLEKLNQITPNKTQLILATHSPILVSKKRENAIPLLPYNIK